jgi:hypothetical protein
MHSRVSLILKAGPLAVPEFGGCNSTAHQNLKMQPVVLVIAVSDGSALDI